jgi:hypothetical protein
MKTITIDNKEIIDTRIRVTYTVHDEEVQLFAGQITVRSEDELNRTLEGILNERTRVETEAEKIKLGEWSPKEPEPVPEPVPPRELTAEEIKQRNITAKEEELRQAIEEARRQKEIRELAAIDENVAAKVDELEAVKTLTIEDTTIRR